jgi:LEA14-like dessication related protein
MRRFFGLVSVGLLPVIVASCAWLRAGAPNCEVSLADVRLESISPFESTFTVYLRVTNKNRRPLSIAGAECELFLEKIKVVSAVSSRAATIPGLDSAVIEASAHASNFSIIPLLDRLIQKAQSGQGFNNLAYEVTGNVHLENAGLFTGKLPFHGAGDLPLSTLMNLKQG